MPAPTTSSGDFFRGMDNADIAKFREEAILGHRPTWPRAKRAARPRPGRDRENPLHDSQPRCSKRMENGNPTGPRRPERQLTRLQVAGDGHASSLPHNATLIEIKARYKELVKRFHPDANGGDWGAPKSV